MIATYYIDDNFDDSTTYTTYTSNTADTGTATSDGHYDWDYDRTQWERVVLLEALIPPPKRDWPEVRLSVLKDVNPLWRKPMRHFYRLHEEKRKGLRR